MAKPATPTQIDIDRATTSQRSWLKLGIAALAVGALALLTGYQLLLGASSYPPDDETEIVAALDALDRGDFALARPVLRAWAERGDSSAQFALARMYANGRGVE